MVYDAIKKKLPLKLTVPEALPEPFIKKALLPATISPCLSFISPSSVMTLPVPNDPERVPKGNPVKDL